MTNIQDGRLAPAYFSPNFKYFDQLLQTVKNKTTVLNLVFKEFLQTSIPPLISLLMQKGITKNFCPTVPNHFIKEPFCVSGIEKFYAQEGNITVFYRKFAVSENRKTS